MSLEQTTEQIRSQLPQLASLGYKVKFAIDGEGFVLIDATQTPPTLSNEDGEADCTIRLSQDRLQQLIDGRMSPTPYGNSACSQVPSSPYHTTRSRSPLMM